MVGGAAFHPEAVGRGAVAVAVTLYAVTRTLSVAVKAVMGTTSLAEVAGIVKAVTTGFVVSPAGLLAALPGKVPASISALLVKVSRSESLLLRAASKAWEVCPAMLLLAKSSPNWFLVPPEVP